VTPSQDDVTFHTELLKLLVTVAWRDGKLDTSEQDSLLAQADGWGLPTATLEPIAESLRTGLNLPPPNVRVLRERPAEVTKAVRALAFADGRVDGWELSLLMEISAMLGVPLK
jgi:tellurite resistance protein